MAQWHRLAFLTEHSAFLQKAGRMLEEDPVLRYLAADFFGFIETGTPVGRIATAVDALSP